MAQYAVVLYQIHFTQCRQKATGFSGRVDLAEQDLSVLVSSVLLVTFQYIRAMAFLLQDFSSVCGYNINLCVFLLLWKCHAKYVPSCANLFFYCLIIQASRFCHHKSHDKYRKCEQSLIRSQGLLNLSEVGNKISISLNGLNNTFNQSCPRRKNRKNRRRNHR